MNILLFILTICFTKEFILLNEEIIINITFIMITIIFINYFNFITSNFEALRVSAKNTLEAESLTKKKALLVSLSLSEIELSTFTNLASPKHEK